MIVFVLCLERVYHPIAIQLLFYVINYILMRPFYHVFTMFVKSTKYSYETMAFALFKFTGNFEVGRCIWRRGCITLWSVALTTLNEINVSRTMHRKRSTPPISSVICKVLTIKEWKFLQHFGSSANILGVNFKMPRLKNEKFLLEGCSHAYFQDVQTHYDQTSTEVKGTCHLKTGVPFLRFKMESL